MGAKHTAAPWEVAGTLVRTARRPEDMSGLLVADCGVTNPDREANARLIAAAPELLEALGWAFKHIFSQPHGDNCYVSDHYEGDPGNRCNCGKESALEAIAAAIAKATGAAL